MNAAIYLRVSTDDQDELNQEPDCVRLCEARGWRHTVVPEVESGANERPRWRHVLELARRGEVRAVVVWSIDRIGRRMKELVDDVEELDRVGCAVVSVREAWLDTTGPTRDLLLAIFAWVAEQERRRLVERTKAGQARARLAGKRFGRPPVDVSSIAVARARQLRSNLGEDGGPRRMSWPEVARQLAREGWPRWTAKTLARAVNGTKVVPGYDGLGPRQVAGHNGAVRVGQN